MRFDVGSFGAHFGCNSMGGSYTQDGPYFRIGSAHMTERECLPAPGSGALSPMAFEEAGLAVLRAGPLIERARPGTIVLRSSAGRIMLARER